MSSYEFSKPTQQNTEQESLSNLSASINIFAGKRLSGDSRKLLTNLLYNGYNYPEGVAACAPIIKQLAEFGINLQGLRSNALEYQKFLKSHTRSSSMQEVVANELKDDTKAIYDFISNLKQRHQEIYNSNTPDDEKNFLRTSDIFIDCLSYTLSFFLTREDIVYHTDIACVVSTLTPPSNPPIQLTEEALSSLKLILDPLEEQRTKFYTTLSPHLLRMISVYLDNARRAYFDQLVPPKVGKGDLVSALTDYEDSALSYATGNSYFRVEHSGQDIILHWNNPLLFSNTATKNIRKEFYNSISPVKSLLRELGGDLHCSIDCDEIKITITCPEQSAPKANDPNTVTDPRVFQITNGGAMIATLPASIKLSLVNNPYDDPINLIIPESCLSNQMERGRICALLSFCEMIDSQRSLDTIQLIPIDGITLCHLKYNGPFINGPIDPNSQYKGDLTIALDHLMIPEVAKNIYNIIQEADCQSLHLSASYLELSSGFIEGIQAAIAKTQQFSNGKLFVDMVALNSTNQEISICDSVGHLIAKGLYMTDLRRFTGRCHAPELTNRVLKAFDEIAASEELNALNTRPEILNKLTEELRKRGINPTESFIEISNHFFKPASVHTNSIADFFNQSNEVLFDLALQTMSAETICRKYRLYITSGMVMMKEENDGTITVEGVDYDTPNRNRFLADKVIG